MYICSLVAKNRWDTQKPESDTCWGFPAKESSRFVLTGIQQPALWMFCLTGRGPIQQYVGADVLSVPVLSICLIFSIASGYV